MLMIGWGARAPRRWRWLRQKDMNQLQVDLLWPGQQFVNMYSVCWTKKCAIWVRCFLDSLKMILAMDLATFRQKKWQDLDLATSKKQNKITWILPPLHYTIFYISIKIRWRDPNLATPHRIRSLETLCKWQDPNLAIFQPIISGKIRILPFFYTLKMARSGSCHSPSP